MEQYIISNDLWIYLISKNIINGDPIYYSVDPTHRIKIEPFLLTKQTDPWTGFVDAWIVTRDELTANEQLWTNWELDILLSAYRTLQDRHIEKQIHISLIDNFLNANDIREVQIVAIPGSSCANVYYKNV